MSVATLLIDIAADTSALKVGLDKARQEIGGFRGNIDKAISGLTSFAGTFGKLAGGVAVIGGIVATVKGLTAEFADAERKGLRLEAVLRATGNTAGFTAEQIKEMAAQLAGKSFFDDEAITAAATELVTFGNISGQVFRDALRLGTDVAEVFDKDITSAVLTVGKALADPAKGMEALRKIGVVLSADQEKTIERFAKTNNLIGEQRALIDALEKAVGGAAESASGGLAGAWHRLSLAIDDAKKAVGGFLFGRGGPSLSDQIAQAFRQGAGLAPKKPLRLGDLTASASIAGQSKEISDLTALAELGKATDADIAKLQELRDGLAQGLTISGVDPDVRLRVARELKSIQDALGDTSILKPLRDYNATIGMGADEMLRYTLRAKGFKDALIDEAVALQRLGRDKTVMEQWRTGLTPAITASVTTGMRIRDQLLSATEKDRPKDLLGLKNFSQDAYDTAMEWKKAWTDAITASSQAFANFFQQAFTEGAKLRDFLKGLLASIANVFATMASTQISKGIGRALGIDDTDFSTYHTGGMVGVGGPTRSMPAFAFAGAPRMHSGGWLAPDEVPAILQKGERVLSRAEAANSGSGSVVHVHQTINFPIHAMDGFSVRQVLDSQAGHIAGIVGRAAREAPGYARSIVANGMRR
jgi:hypothetical protein